MCAEGNNLQSNCPIIFGQAQNSECLEQEFSITKENRQCKPCMANKTIQFQLIKNIWRSSKFQVPQARNFNLQKTRQCKPCVPNETICNPIVQEHLEKLKIPSASCKKFPPLKKTGITKCSERDNLQSNCSRLVEEAQNSKCLEQEFSITKENRQCKPCMPNKTIRFQLIKNIWRSSNFQVPQARNFNL